MLIISLATVWVVLLWACAALDRALATLTTIDDVFRVVPMGDSDSGPGTTATPEGRVQGMVVDHWLPMLRDLLRRRLAAGKALSSGEGADGDGASDGAVDRDAAAWKQAYRAALMARSAPAAVDACKAVAAVVSRTS